jgi:DNA-binding protein YbaB
MLEKLKQLRKIKKQMENVEIEEEINGVKVKMNGSMKILAISIADRNDRKLEKNIRKAVNAATKTIQKKMAQDMMAGGDLF